MQCILECVQITHIMYCIENWVTFNSVKAYVCIIHISEKQKKNVLMLRYLQNVGISVSSIIYVFKRIQQSLFQKNYLVGSF